MLSKVRRRLEQEEGFTLIELLVVILIIGILAAVAIPTFLNQRNKAFDSNAESNLKNAQIAVEGYANDNNGTYPVSGTFGSAYASSVSDPSLNIAGVTMSGGGSTTDSYVLTATASNGITYTLTVANGTTTYGASGTGITSYSGSSSWS